MRRGQIRVRTAGLDRRALLMLEPGLQAAYRSHIAKRIADPNGLWERLLKMEMEFERDFVKAGGLLVAGTDPTGSGGVIAGFGDQREVELLVEAGFNPEQAIKIATYNGALFLGQGDRIGILSKGKQADIIAVRGNLWHKRGDGERVGTLDSVTSCLRTDAI